MLRTTVCRTSLVLAVFAMAILSCALPAGADAPIAPGPPATPAIFLPPAWTPTAGPPTPDVPADWEEFHAGRVHLWLPGNFEGGDMGVGFQAILDSLKSLGPEFAQTAQIIEQNPDLFVLWAFDPQAGPSGYATNVNVTREDVPAGTSVDDYLDASLELLPSYMDLVDRGTVSVGGMEAGKMVLSSEVQGKRGLSAVYSIKEGDRFWNVTYSTGADEFVDRTPIWDRSIGTFRLGD